jgi:hypothetical protein
MAIEGTIIAKLAAKFGESLIAGAVLGSVGGGLRAMFANKGTIPYRLTLALGGVLAGAVAFLITGLLNLSEGTSVGIAIGVALSTRELVELIPRLIRNHSDSVALKFLPQGLRPTDEDVPKKPARKVAKKPTLAKKKAPAKKVSKKNAS